MVANSAPRVRLGVSTPPAAPARMLAVIASAFSASRLTASLTPRPPSNPSCEGPLPFPGSCGNSVASRPMPKKTARHHGTLCQPRGVCAVAARVTALNPYAATPKTGPATIDQAIRDGLISRCGTMYCGTSPKPIQATIVATTDVTMAGTKALNRHSPDSGSLG